MSTVNSTVQNPNNLLLYSTPSVYQILCLSTNTVYIGETKNLLEKLRKHSCCLINNSDDCKALQHEWNLFNSENFTFTIICSGSQWALNKDRLKKEKSVLKEKINQSYNVYNTDASAAFIKQYNRAISINDKTYRSVAEAAKSPVFSTFDEVVEKSLAKTRQTVRRRINSKKWPN